MNPIVKYTGGKSKELPIIKHLLPKQFKTVIEPFCGGAALSFDLCKDAILLDANPALINLYRQVADPIMFQEVFSEVCRLKTLKHDDLEKEYYKARDYLNHGDPDLDGEYRDPYSWAASYIIVRQLCFSGMERYNSKGEFNVPFGHYQKFKCSLNWEHMKFLKRCEIHEGDFHTVIWSAGKDDLIFIDPPHLSMAGKRPYSGDHDLHERLVEQMNMTQAKWLFVHDEDEFYKHELSQYHIMYKDVGSIRRPVRRMYVTNYENDMTLHHVANDTLLDAVA